METILGIESGLFWNAFWWIGPPILLLSFLSDGISYFIGRESGNRESRGVTTGTLNEDCVYRFVKNMRIHDLSPLISSASSSIFFLKEKTPDGIEMMRYKVLETSFISLRDQYMDPIVLESFPRFFSYKKGRNDKFNSLLILTRISEEKYKKYRK